MCDCTGYVAVARNTVHADEDYEIVLEYTILKRETYYGLRVDKRSVDGELLDREQQPALTGSLEEMMTLTNAFSAGTVFPCTLNDLLEDWYSNDILDLESPPAEAPAWEDYAT